MFSQVRWKEKVPTWGIGRFWIVQLAAWFFLMSKEYSSLVEGSVVTLYCTFLPTPYFYNSITPSPGKLAKRT